MNKLYSFLGILLLLSLSQPIKAQREVVTAGQYLRKANTAYAERNYNRALECYDVVLKDNPNPDNKDIIWNAAESARLTHHYVVAENYYQLLAKTDVAKNYPKLNLNWAQVRKSLENYDGAIQLLQVYAGSAAIASTVNNEKNEAQAEIEACEWAKTIANPDLAKYKLTSVGDKVNTPYTDLAPRQHNGVLYYSTAFFPKKEDAKPVLHIFSNDMKKESVDLPFNSTKEGESTTHFALNTEGGRVYFNQCQQKDNGEFHCEIFYRDKNTDGSWKDVVRLPDTINTTAFTASQPAIGFDKATGREVLYFVSDRKGGKGGMDIWYSDISADGKFSIPQNLSSVNTAKDDITPYFLKDNQYLFFSSNGYKSLGGLDIYYVQKMLMVLGLRLNMAVIRSIRATTIHIIRLKMDVFTLFQIEKAAFATQPKKIVSATIFTSMTSRLT
ncbi:MAG: tetratricopeptide repeat protein [Saprospiraceae bacterium]|nr:tetratricopeptide repeat protein [Saprospiraceae bacterium]